jgi:hypothetical protein
MAFILSELLKIPPPSILKNSNLLRGIRGKRIMWEKRYAFLNPHADLEVGDWELDDGRGL